MELTQLKYFLTVAKNQHVTKSAEELHVAQPALTQSIHRLQNELEVPLFYTKGRNIALTPYGQYFYDKLNPLIQKLESLPEDLLKMAKNENSTIHLNVLAASTLLTDAIIEFQKIDSSVHFQIQQNEKSEFYDICITTKLFYQDYSKNNENKIINSYENESETFVCTEKIYLAVPNIPRFSKKNKISLSEVSDMGFISLSGSKQLRAICDKFCLANEFKPNFIFESDNPAAVKNMIAANMGIGFWPSFSWGKIDTSKVLLLEIQNPPFSRDLLLTCRKNKQENTKLEEFWEHLKKIFAKLSNE